MAFQYCLAETKQVEALMGLKADIKIVDFVLYVVHIEVTDSETVTAHAITKVNWKAIPRIKIIM